MFLKSASLLESLYLPAYIVLEGDVEHSQMRTGAPVGSLDLFAKTTVTQIGF